MCPILMKIQLVEAILRLSPNTPTVIHNKYYYLAYLKVMR